MKYLRWILTAALMVAIYYETGIFTTIAMCLINLTIILQTKTHNENIESLKLLLK